MRMAPSSRTDRVTTVNAELAKSAKTRPIIHFGSVRLQPDLCTTINAEIAEFAEKNLPTKTRETRKIQSGGRVSHRGLLAEDDVLNLCARQSP